MTQPTVSIIVPVYNGAETIEQCIEALLAQNYVQEKLEILVVDNNSTDNTAELIKKYPVTYLKEEKKGACCARNKGIAEAKGELLAFTDSDCIAEKEWVSKLVPHFENQKIGGVGGHLAAYPTDNVIEQYIEMRKIINQEVLFRENKNSPPFFITANVMYRAEVVKKVGGFDDFFNVAGEDADLAWRIVELGYELYLEGGAVVQHKHRSDIKRLWNQLFSYGMGTAAIFKRYHKKLRQTYWIEPMAYENMIRGWLRAPLYLLTKKGKLEKYTPLLDGINNLAFILGKMWGSIKYRVIVL